MDYERAVQQAAAALKRGDAANWELSQLTFQNTVGSGGRPKPPLASMATWSADVRKESGREFSPAMGKYYRAVWAKLGAQAASLSWSEAYAEIRGMTVRERFAKYETAERAVEKASDEEKREIFEQLSEDPAVVEDTTRAATVLSNVAQASPEAVAEALRNPETREALSEGTRQHEEEVAEQIEDRVRADTTARMLDAARYALEMQSSLLRWIRSTEKSARHLSGLSREDIQARFSTATMTSHIERGEQCLATLRQLAETGESDLDSFLASVLGARR